MSNAVINIGHHFLIIVIIILKCYILIIITTTKLPIMIKYVLIIVTVIHSTSYSKSYYPSIDLTYHLYKLTTWRKI